MARLAHESASAPRLAVVTGGASGIGLAVVQRLLAQGWVVVAVDADPAALGRLAAAAPGARGVQLDITDEAGVAALFAELGHPQAATPLRGLVNSAGIGKSIPFLQTDAATFRKTVEVNLVGTFLMGQAAARCMAAGGGGAVVNLSSGSALRGNTGRAAYGASKGGVETLTKVMAVELATFGVRVNAIAPGPIETPLVATMHSAADRARATASVPQGRYGQAQEVAQAVVFLLDGDQSAYITGTTLCVDGGFHAAGSFAHAAR